jgi:hypothetical protein
MVKNFYILYGSPIGQHMYEYFGGDLIKNNGLELKLFDLSPIIHPQLFEKATIIEDYQGDDKEVVFNKKEFLQQLSSLKEDTFIMNCLTYDKDSCDIYRAISKSKAFHTIDVDVALPLFDDTETGKQVFFSRVKKITIPKLVRYIRCTLKPFLIKKFSRYPDFLIAGGESSIKHSANGHLAGRTTEILWTHTSDYNKYLEFENKQDEVDYKPTAVFLCGSAPMFLRDNLAAEDTCSLTIEVYYPSLRRFFDRIESELALTVEIAGHPGAAHSKYPDYFGGRLTLQGKTMEMIARSKLVLSHGSAACSFAVLFNKPTIQFITDQFIKEDVLLRKAMADWLDTELINIDKSLDRDWKKELDINHEAYENYKNHFIKIDGTENINFWQIVANRIKKIA